MHKNRISFRSSELQAGDRLLQSSHTRAAFFRLIFHLFFQVQQSLKYIERFGRYNSALSFFIFHVAYENSYFNHWTENAGLGTDRL